MPFQPPPLKRNSSRTRNAILGAARSRFARSSYSDVGLRAISCDAGVDVALVGRYFGSKKKLLEVAWQNCTGG